MAANVQSHTPGATAPQEQHAGSRLGSFLCWAVVFADIGTSVYYVPGILYGQYSTLAGLFVVLTLSVFILLTLKYAEVTERFPEGGGVVTVASRALGPWMGALGGMLILVDYFLTAAISSLSGLIYFAVVAPAVKPYVLWATIIVLVLLGLLNWYGIKESASVSAVIALIAFVSDMVVILVVFIHVPLARIGQIFTQMFATRELTLATFIAGFAGAFLAFSGLESISQLSPVMRVPRSRVAGWALAFVVVTVGLTSPLLTVFSTTLLCAHGVQQGGQPGGLLTCVNAAGQALDPAQFISLLGGQYGGAWLGIAVAVSASALLIFASNTAIIGSYHVFLALTRMQFFPKPLIATNRMRGTPHVAILLATIIPIGVLIGATGQIDLLGDLYAFGLLGAFTLTCLGIDIVRWRERRGAARYGPTQQQEEAEVRAQTAADAHRPPGAFATLLTRVGLAERLEPGADALARAGRITRARLRAVARRARPWPIWRALALVRERYGWQIKFGLGILTTALVCFAWAVNLYNKHLATMFGLSVTAIGLAIAFTYQTTKAQPTVYPLPNYGPLPDAWLVILPVGGEASVADQRRALVRAAARGAEDRPLVFLYVQPQMTAFVPTLFEIDDPYGRDEDAQYAFSRAAVVANREGVPYRAQRFIYRQGGEHQIAEVWRALKPEETVALASQGLAKVIRVDYVRRDDEDTNVKFYGSRGAVNTAAGGEPSATARTEGGISVEVVGLPARIHILISGWVRGLRAAVRNLFARQAPPPTDETEAADEEDALGANGQAESPADISGGAATTPEPEPERRIHKPGLPRGAAGGGSGRSTPPLAPPRDPTAPGATGTESPSATGDDSGGNAGTATDGSADASSSERRPRHPSRPLR